MSKYTKEAVYNLAAREGYSITQNNTHVIIEKEGVYRVPETGELRSNYQKGRAYPFIADE